ncbi:hypothetical protein M5X06_12665 [Paenibacillus alvei]|uniref:Sigma-70 family RNA polymerase sigma factor n=1 Tax=Paenibacillus alvei TaxID=44250 RepID=A0ABT4GUJ4_PAEAL|nr:hypothetical protein [Paenibacillus alvei]MCY9760372.1 hypothetical protein [Paenibacillus alvei]MCY9767664.1 hypothetical protein [Paenibacillus alvei]
MSLNLNEKVMEYKRTGSQGLFSEIYREVSRPWKNFLMRDARFAMTDTQEIEALYDDKLLQVIEKFDQARGNFISVLATAIANAVKNLRVKNARRYRMEVYAKGDEDEPTILDRPDVNVNVESRALSSIKTKEQRELLSHLTVNLDDLTCEVVKLYLVNDSYLAVGKRLGIEHKRVKRKIESLSRRYDGNRFGDYRDYLYA